MVSVLQWELLARRIPDVLLTKGTAGNSPQEQAVGISLSRSSEGSLTLENLGNGLEVEAKIPLITS